MYVLKFIIAALAGAVLAFGCYFGLLHLFGVAPGTASAVGVVCAVIGGTYAGLVMGMGVYDFKPLSVIGLFLDVTWSLLNTLAGMVWMIACAAAGAKLTVSTDSRRSGTFAFDKNPRGGGYDATTIGTCIGGGWSSHEECHVWQARLFGPLYMPVYLVCLALNLLARLVTGKTGNAVFEAYRRICWEDWAYLAGVHPGSTIKWGGWVGGFFLCLLYVGLILLIPIGIAYSLLLLIAGILGLIAYSVIRSLTPA